jgi:hypothetical protein
MRLAMIFALLAVPVAAQEAQKMPSGLVVHPFEAFFEEQGTQTWLILRYLAPDIARDLGRFDADQVQNDLDHLCQTDGLAQADGADGVLITLLDRPHERGVADPSVTQFISPYRIENGTCIWELY